MHHARGNQLAPQQRIGSRFRSIFAIYLGVTGGMNAPFQRWRCQTEWCSRTDLGAGARAAEQGSSGTREATARDGVASPW
jgi:hypothetical protein